MENEILYQNLKELEEMLGLEVGFWNTFTLKDIEVSDNNERKVVELGKLLEELHFVVRRTLYPGRY
ncbi:hypothetical protein SAMN04487995_0940 [Dyadobacter koreensis]|uniref:Uncharacterized protein n=1 Tax=Dyadobacter koreensis TaxID=408657 RepID=A0A1H6R587_9BACT|nr:hypothetical protein [Dyadobacter koreensis]SEI46362.1 hypothetical protein SAMN04487995_0940 [Dyadobacter koreensis]